MSADQSFGILAKNRRRELGLTQDELARRVGCAPITIRKIEADDLRPSVQIAERMAMALNIPLEERAAFVKLARTELTPAEEPKVTPMPAWEEIGNEDLTGRAIRGYALGERLGNGGMGAVYRAIQPLVEREVAIKIILPKFANHPDFIRRFEAEAQLVARLEHPHIVPLYDYWREPNVAYLVMRLLRGGSVQSLLKNGTALPPDTVLHLVKQIGSALSAAHRAGVVHRDLKPANVLLDEDNNAYLADFGIAKNLSSFTSETQADVVLGSPDYISPEQIKAEFIRPQTDIYALGVMLYELLTGAVPFRGPTPFEVMHQHLTSPLPPLSASRVGLPGSLDEVIKHATAKDPLQRYETVDEMLNDLRDVLADKRSQDKAAAIHSQPTVIPLTERDNPYKGLRAFGEGDAQDFFGREALLQQLLIRLGEGGELSRFLTVVGPSGSGKSSVVKAGLIPALRRGALPGSEQWFIVELMPGVHPLEELEAALLRVAVNPPASLMEQFTRDNRGLIRAVRRSLPVDPNIELVLVIDQFEEVFTLVQDENERIRFLGLLVAAALDEASRIHIIATVRADFIDRPLAYMDFGEILRQRMEIVLPLTTDEMESAIASPAGRVGLTLEPGLVPTMMHDLADQPGALPLLQFALTELFEKREANALTKSAYQEIGGVLGALGRRAEEVYNGLTPECQEIARQLFLRLVTLGEGVEDTRRRVLIAELESLQLGGSISVKEHSKSFKATLDAFGHSRLLSFDRDPGTRGPTVEVAHEAILREWSRLREWLNESRTLVRMQRQLGLEAAEWQSAKHDESFLLTGTKLSQYDGWLENTPVALTENELEFLKASNIASEEHQAQELARQKRELETAQKLAETEKARAEEQTKSVEQLRQRAWYLIGALALALIAALIAGTLASRNNLLALQNSSAAKTAQAAEEAAKQNAQTAQVAEVAANQNEKLAKSRELAAAAINNLNIDPERSILLALQALSVQYSPEAENALRLSLATSRVKLTLAGDEVTYATDFSPDGKHLVTAEENGIAQIWDIQNGQEVLRLDVTATQIAAIFYNPSGDQLITADYAGFIKTWNAMTGKEISRIKAHNGGIDSMSMSADGLLLATTGSKIVKIWDATTGEERFTLIRHHNYVTSLAFSRDGTRLASADYDGNVNVWDTATGQSLLEFYSNEQGCYLNTLFNADGSRLIISSSCGDVRFWDISGIEVQELFHRKVQASGGSVSLNLSPDGTQLAVGENKLVSFWDASTGFDLFALPNDWQVFGADFSPDGRFFAAGGASKTIKVWDLSLPGEKLVFTAHEGNRVGDVAFSPDGTWLATESLYTGDARIWDAITGEKLITIKESNICCSVAFSPDRTQLITGSLNGTANIWDTTTGELVKSFTGHTDQIARAIFSPDGTRVATASNDGAVKIWDVTSGKRLITLLVHNGGWVNDVAFSPDGKLVATSNTNTGAYGGIVNVWDTVTGKWLMLLGKDVSNTPVPWGIAFSPDGKQLAVGYGDNVVRVWDIASMKSQNQPLLTLRGHSALIWRVAFNPDGKHLGTASDDGTIKIWDVSPSSEQGQEITTLSGHTAEVSGVSFSPDGKYLASSSLDGTVRVYFIHLEDLVAYARTRVTRSLTTEECQKYLHVDTCPAQ